MGRFRIALLLFSILGACSSIYDVRIPDVTKDAIEAADVLYSFECELVEALAQAGRTNGANGSSFFTNKAVRASFTLKASARNGIGPNIEAKIPSGVTTLTLGADFLPSTNSVISSEFRVSYNTNSLGECSAEREAQQSLTRIQSGLGLADWARQIHLIETKTGKDVELVSYTIEFNISNGVKGKSSARVKKDGRSDIEFEFLPSKSRVSNHKIVFTLEDLEDPVKRVATNRIPAAVESRLDDLLDSVIERSTR